MISGILPVDKPLGWTSHDVVGRVRRLAGQKRVGHAGTLDPLATGVLLVMLGHATRLSAYAMAVPKCYIAEVVLGVSTVTDDSEAPAQRLADVSHMQRDDIARCLPRFVGRIRQIPPVYSAVRHGGEKMYALARRGVEVQAESRTVDVFQLDLLAWNNPLAYLRVRCGSGTYIRSLARDLGGALGTGGYLHGLRRVTCGGFSVEECQTLDTLTTAPSIMPYMQPMDRALFDLPAAVLDTDDAGRISRGLPVLLDSEATGTVRMYDLKGTLVALAETRGHTASPSRVFTETR